MSGRMKSSLIEIGKEGLIEKEGPEHSSIFSVVEYVRTEVGEKVTVKIKEYYPTPAALHLIVLLAASYYMLGSGRVIVRIALQGASVDSGNADKLIASIWVY